MGKVDRRIRRTQKALHDALISLVFEKNYDSITVQEILDRADVGRATFYAHFESKDERAPCAVVFSVRPVCHSIKWSPRSLPQRATGKAENEKPPNALIQGGSLTCSRHRTTMLLAYEVSFASCSA
jgi:hypothetical protein